MDEITGPITFIELDSKPLVIDTQKFSVTSHGIPQTLESNQKSCIELKKHLEMVDNLSPEIMKKIRNLKN